MKIARQPRILASTPMNDTSPFPAPSLRELSRPTGVTEGVSSDGCSGPTIYTPAHINSETFERLRTSKYTPSVSHSLDSSLREGAGGTGRTIQHAAQKPQRCGRFSSPLRSSEVGRFYHSTKYTPSVSHSLDSSLREGAGKRPHSTGCSLNRGVGGRFSSPLRNCEFSTSYEYGVHPPQRGGWNGV